MTQLVEFRRDLGRVNVNMPLVLGIFLAIFLLDILNNESQMAISLPLEVRSVAVFLLAFANLTLIVFDTKRGFFVFVFLLIAQNAMPLFSQSGFTSIYATEIVPYIDLIELLVVALVAKVIIDACLKGRIRFVGSRIHVYVLIMAVLVVLESAWGFARYESLVYFARDIQGFLYLFGLFGIICFLDLSKKNLENLAWLIILGYGAKAVLYVLKFVLEIGRPYGAGLRTIFGGDPHLFLISFFALAALLFYALTYRNFDIRSWLAKWLLIPGIIGFQLFFWILNPSRGTWLVLGVLVIIAFWHFYLSLTKKVLLFGSVGVLALGFIGFLSMAESPTLQGIYQYISWQGSTLLEVERWTDFTSPGSYSVRAAEFVNVHHKLQENGTLLVGEGLGSWWSIDGYIDLTKVLGDADDPTGGFSTVHPRGTHFPLSEMLLKFGFLGSLLYWGLWAAILWELRRLFMSTSRSYHRSLLFGFALASLGLLAGGFLQYKIYLGICMALAPKLYFYSQKEVT